ncbi:MAG TPA: alpha/beta fold hydrolase [Ktedonobacteraceae bacterium]|nr:alpha/beta fold hydrolase [Ktedonobacteraceae bacterium]
MRSELRGDPWIFSGCSHAAARLRLFCFPCAGGGASLYCPWIKALAPDIDVYPVQLPGRENRLLERPFTRFDELIRALAQALQPYFEGPFAFFGHSMGALVCFGLTRYLLQQDQPVPVHLFLSAYRAPQLPNKEQLHSLSDAELIHKVLELNGTQRSIFENLELRQLLLPIFRADFSVCETYPYEPMEPLAIPITAFGGLQDRRVSRAALGAWSMQTRGPFVLHMLPGNHFFWRDSPQQVWQIISQASGAQNADICLYP